MQRTLEHLDISPTLFVGGVVIFASAAASLWLASPLGKLFVIATVGLGFVAAVFRLRGILG